MANSERPLCNQCLWMQACSLEGTILAYLSNQSMVEPPFSLDALTSCTHYPEVKSETLQRKNNSSTLISARVISPYLDQTPHTAKQQTQHEDSTNSVVIAPAPMVKERRYKKRQRIVKVEATLRETTTSTNPDRLPFVHQLLNLVVPELRDIAEELVKHKELANSEIMQDRFTELVEELCRGDDVTRRQLRHKINRMCLLVFLYHNRHTRR